MTARLRLLELPTQVRGEDVETPFVLVFDRVPDDALIAEHVDRLDAVVKAIGASGALVFADEIDIEL